MNDIRDAILEASEELEDADEVVETAEVEEEVSDEVVEEPTDIESETAVNDPEEADPTTPVEATTEEDVKPPATWSPANREHWAGMDKGVQTQIMKREREVDEALRQSAESRSVMKEFNNMVEPYKAMIQAEGGASPMQAVNGLLGTAATLASGSQQAKAQRISQLINHYGVDIETLDTILSGGEAQAPQMDAATQAMNARLAPMEQMFQNMQNQQQQQTNQQNQQLNDDIGSFGAKAEFFNDVRLDMADIMDMANTLKYLK